MLVRHVVTLLVGIAVPVAAQAVEANLALNGSGQYDTNVARDDNGDEQGDFSFRVGPSIRVHDELRKFDYNLAYNPVYQKFVEQDQLDKLSHFASGFATYRFGDRTSVSLTEQFSLTQRVSGGSQVQEQGPDGEILGEPPTTETQGGDIYRNLITFSGRHSFSPRTVGQFTANHTWFDSDNSNTVGSQSLSGLGSLTYALTARDRVGLGGGVNYQKFDAITGQPASDSLTYRVFVSWLHTFGENTEFSIRAGPALIVSSQDQPDPESSGQKYPHQVVDQAGTVDEVFARLGLQTPSRVTAPAQVVPGSMPPIGLAATVLAPGSQVPANSVVIPDPNRCNSATNSSTLVYVESSCPFNSIARNDPAMYPDEAALASEIRSAMTPAFVFPPGQDPGSTDGSSLTYFGEVSLTHRWLPNLSSSLAYSRSDSSASSLGSSTIADNFSFTTSWEPTRRLDFDLRAEWLKRTSANELTNTFVGRDTGFLFEGGAEFAVVDTPGTLVSEATDRSVDTTYYSVSGRVAYRVARRMTLLARVTFQKQDTKRETTTDNSSFNDVIGFLGFRYDFEPFRF